MAASLRSGTLNSSVLRRSLVEMDFLQILATIAAVSGGFGIAYAVFTSAKVQSTINLYKEENTAQGKRITTLDADVRVAKEALEAMKRENDMLRDLATGKTALEAMMATLTREETQRHAEHQAMMVVLEAIAKRLDGGGNGR